MPITSDWEKGYSKRVRAIETAFAITPTDHVALVKRLRAAETAAGLAGSAAAIKENNAKGIENRLRALEAAV